jgi:hypothetical protein
MGVLKFLKLGLLRLWSPITLRADLQLKWGLKHSCSPRRELFKGMSHATWMQENWVDFWLLVVRSQIGKLTFSPSFGHNLCSRYSNGSCEPILDIYVLKTFQWYKELLNPMNFEHYNRWDLGFLKIWKSIGTLISKMGAHLGVCGFIPSHSLALSWTWNVISRLVLGSHLCKPLPWSRVQG